jgi:protein tyrosine phosphatase type 4A
MSNTAQVPIPFNRILSPVEHNHLRFLILDCPTDNTLPLYLGEMKQRGVSDVVRVCEPTYNKNVLEDNNIKVHDWPFKDGGIPPNDLILNFLSLCDDRFNGLLTPQKQDPIPCIVLPFTHLNLGCSLCRWTGKSSHSRGYCFDRNWNVPHRCR